MPYKLILADSSPLVQKVVQMAFGPPDFEVHALEDGLEAHAGARPGQPGRRAPGSLRFRPATATKSARYLRSREDFRRSASSCSRTAFEPLDEERRGASTTTRSSQKPFDSEGLALSVREIVDRKKGPPPVPEEALLEEASGSGVRPLFKDDEFPPPEDLPAPEDELEDKVRVMLRDEDPVHGAGAREKAQGVAPGRPHRDAQRLRKEDPLDFR